MVKQYKKINCNVKSCEFNNLMDNECTLKEIKVSCDCNQNNVTNKSETICSSFEKAQEKE